MIDQKKWPQYGYQRSEHDVQGITIHETGNLDMTARQLFDYLNEECKTSQGCHYVCDDKETIQIMPDDWAVYHTGKGLDWGNRYTIAIEIVSSLSDQKYQEAQDRAVDLIRSLQEEYGISYDLIFFHNDFDNKTYCPKTILDNYGSSVNFAYQVIYQEGE